MNADQWFTVARAMVELLLLGVLLWFVGRLICRAVRFIADARQRERERERVAAERRAASSTPPGYLRDRFGGAVRH